MSDLATFFVVLGCKVSLILGIVAALVLSVGRCWPLFCTTWQRASIIALLVLPLAVSFAPAIYLPVLPLGHAKGVVHAPTIEGSTGIEQSDAPTIPVGKTTSWAEVDFESAESIAPAESLQSIDTHPTEADLCPATSIEPVIIHPSVDWNAVLLLALKTAYLTIVATFLIRLAGAWFRLADLRRKSLPIDANEWRSLLVTWTTKLNVRRTVELLASDEVSIPMTFGWLRPTIVVPRRNLASYGPVEREAILVHELTHISRNDFFWQIVIHFTSAAYWCHPLAWHLRRSSDNLRERICDMFCSQLLGQEHYAKALIAIAAQSQGLRLVGLGMAMAHQSSLGRRLDEMKSFERSPLPGKGRASGVLVCAIAALVSGAIVIGTLAERPSQAIPVAHSFADPSMYDVDQVQNPAPNGDSSVGTNRLSDAPDNFFDAQPLVAFGAPNFVDVNDIVVSTTLNSAGIDFLQPDKTARIDEDRGRVFVVDSDHGKRSTLFQHIHFTSPHADVSVPSGSMFHPQTIQFEDAKESHAISYGLSRGIQFDPIPQGIIRAVTRPIELAESSSGSVVSEISNSTIDLTVTSDGTIVVNGLQYEEKEQGVQKRKYIQYGTRRSDPGAWEVQDKKDPKKELLKTTRAEVGASDAY